VLTFRHGDELVHSRQTTGWVKIGEMPRIILSSPEILKFSARTVDVIRTIDGDTFLARLCISATAAISSRAVRLRGIDGGRPEMTGGLPGGIGQGDAATEHFE